VNVRPGDGEAALRRMTRAGAVTVVSTALFSGR